MFPPLDFNFPKVAVIAGPIPQEEDRTWWLLVTGEREKEDVEIRIGVWSEE